MSKKLTLADILTHPVISTTPDQMVREVLQLMQEHRISAVVVVEGSCPVGIFTERDAVIFSYRRMDAGKVRVAEVMSSRVMTANPALGYREGYKLIAAKRVRHLVVTDDSGGLCGVISEGDFLVHLGTDFMLDFKKVGDVMTEEVVTLTQSSTVDEALRLMMHGRASCIVIEDEGCPLGVYTERDLIRQQPTENDLNVALEAVMSKPARIVSVGTALPDAIQIMDKAKVRRLVVVGDTGALQGLVTRHDIVKQLNDEEGDHLRNALARSERELESVRSSLKVASKLQAAEARLRSIVNSVPCGIQDCDLEGTITYSNPAHHHILGYNQGELVGKKVWDFEIGEQQREISRDVYKSLIQNHQNPDRIVSLNQRKDGKRIHVQIDWDYNYDANGEVVGTTSVITDVTEKVETDERLLKVASDVSRAQSVANLGNWSFSLKDSKNEWSDQTYKIFGWERSKGPPSDELLFTCFHPEEREAHAAYRQKMHLFKPGMEMELFRHRIVRPDGVQRWVEVTSECEFDEHGSPKFFFGTVMDITDRIEREKQIQQSEARFRDLYQKTPVMMHAIDLEFRLLEFNDRWLKTLGYEREEVAGRKVIDFMTAESIERAKSQYMPQLLKTGELKDAAVEFYKKNGEVIDFELSALPEYNDDGKILRLMGFMVDVTDRNRARSALIESESRLRTIFNTAREGILLADIESKNFIEGNAAIARMLGYSQAELTQLKVNNIHPAENIELVLTEFRKLSSGKSTIAHELPILRKDGSIFYADISAAPLELGGRRCFLGIFMDVTDRRETEKLQKQSEEKFRALFEQTGGYCLILDPNTENGMPIIVDVNRAACEGYGYKREEFIGLQISDISGGDGKEYIKPRIDEIMKGRPFYFETTDIRKDGTNFTVAVYGNRINLDGLPPLILETVFDISERVQARENLWRYEQIVSSSKDMLALLDQNYKYKTANSSYLDAFGLSYAELIGLTPEDLFGTEYFDTVIRPHSDECLTGKIVNYQGWIKYPELGRQFMDIHYYPYWDSNNEVQGYVVNARNETQRELAEVESRERGLQLKEAQKIAQLGNWELDLVTNIFTWSDEIFRMFDLEPNRKGVAYDDFIEWVHPDDRVSVYDLVKKLSTDLSAEFQYRLIRADRKVRWISGKGKTELDDTGNPVRLYGVMQDVSRAHILESQLRQAQKLESVGRLAGGVAHDFNNMLGVILGHTELILAKMDLDFEFHANLAQIKLAASRSADLTRQLLAFARQQPVSPKVIALNDSVMGVAKMLQSLIGEDVDFTLLPGEEVWPIKIDPSQLDQILANLCVNARDAIAGVGKVTVETANAVFDERYCRENAGYQAGEFAMLVVRDTGCGMDSTTLENVFEPFFSTKGQGTGLGLATVYGVVKQNGGFIDVVSEPNLGSTFKVYLPRHADTKSLRSSESEAVAQIERGDEVILLVEDEPLVLEMTQSMLEMAGYTVISADTPGAALRHAKEHNRDISLMVSDVVMPEMNGRELSKSILSLYPEIKCLFMSGYTADVVIGRGVADKGMNFIQKPFKMRELADKVRTIIDSE